MRAPFLVFVSIAFGIVLASVATLAQQRTQTLTFPVDQLRPGMRGYGLTVFRGTQPERFDVEVIDVLHNFRPDQDLILARTPHPILNRAIAVGGMSGSPIFFEGKLAGAYAYGWPFGHEPVIGITPIKNMMADLVQPVRRELVADPLVPSRFSRSNSSHARRAGLAPYVGGPRGAFDVVREYRHHNPPSSLSFGIEAAATPIMLGGVDTTVASLLSRELEPLGLIAHQGGASGQSSSVPSATRFVDGGAIGVQLIRGDISATAIGTVTHVGANDRLVAFGHPMMNMGEIELPTSTARVLHIFSSAARSFKIAEAIAPLGALLHDRQASIVVDTNEHATTIPVTIRLHGVQAPRTVWNVDVANHRALSPVLVFSALLNAIKTTSPDQTDVMFRARYAADIEGYGRVELEDQGNMFSGPADLGALSRLRLFELFDAAYGNPFIESNVSRVELDFYMRFARDAMQIVEASVLSQEVDPGSDVDIRVVLRRFGQPDRVRTVVVHIPEHAAGKQITLELESGSDVRSEQPTARNLGDLIEQIEDRYPATSLVVALKMPSRGLRFRGHVVRSLPRSALNSLQRTTGTGPSRPFVTYLRRAVDMGEVVVGSTRIGLRVRQLPSDR